MKNGLIKVSALKMITNLRNKKEIRTARESGLITMVRKGGKIFYQLKTVHPALIKPITRKLSKPKSK